jgi:hypothetical protein
MKNIYIKNNNRYTDKGYKNRIDYFNSLSERFNIDINSIFALGDMLGIDEDFDGLVSSLDDYQYLTNGNALHLN